MDNFNKEVYEQILASFLRSLTGQMLEGLERIFQEAVKTDEVENNPPGNGRWYFYFYDSGFAAHCESLRNRLGLPQLSKSLVVNQVFNKIKNT